MKRILVIDDDTSVRDSIKRQLTGRLSLDIDYEGDPVVGLDRLATQPYDLVLCDIKMTPIDGLEVLARIRAAHPLLPVVILTGFVDDQIVERAHELGCAEFLIKPVRRTELIGTIKGVLAR